MNLPLLIWAFNEFNLGGWKAKTFEEKKNIEQNRSFYTNATYENVDIVPAYCTYRAYLFPFASAYSHRETPLIFYSLHAIFQVTLDILHLAFDNPSLFFS